MGWGLKLIVMYAGVKGRKWPLCFSIWNTIKRTPTMLCSPLGSSKNLPLYTNAKLFWVCFLECPSNLLTIFNSLSNFRVPEDHEFISYYDKINVQEFEMSWYFWMYCSTVAHEIGLCCWLQGSLVTRHHLSLETCLNFFFLCHQNRLLISVMWYRGYWLNISPILHV